MFKSVTRLVLRDLRSYIRYSVFTTCSDVHCKITTLFDGQNSPDASLFGGCKPGINIVSWVYSETNFTVSPIAIFVNICLIARYTS